jgi:hypothetical protein
MTTETTEREEAATTRGRETRAQERAKLEAEYEGASNVVRTLQRRRSEALVEANRFKSARANHPEEAHKRIDALKEPNAEAIRQELIGSDWARQALKSNEPVVALPPPEIVLRAAIGDVLIAAMHEAVDAVAADPNNAITFDPRSIKEIKADEEKAYERMGELDVQIEDAEKRAREASAALDAFDRPRASR